MLTITALFTAFFLCTHSASGSYPKAQNVHWSSINFHTTLQWEPKPSADYSYTVEFSKPGADRGQRKVSCVRSSEPSCDLSDALTDLNAYYTADVLSEPPLGAPSDPSEPPYTRSPKFCPYQDTNISKPEFKLEVSQDKKKTTLYVTDPLTALFKDNHQLNIRDIFSDQLQYKVTYRRNKSTGKKVHFSKSSIIELTDLDKGESYCFEVQAFIPSRSIDKQLGELSRTQCSKLDDPPFFKVYSVAVIASGILLIFLLIGFSIAIGVICHKRRKNALKEKGKEGESLQGV